MRTRNRMTALAALFASATVAAIGWYTVRALPQGRTTAGFGTFFLTFSSGLALPYLVTIVLLMRRGGRDGLRLALATAVVNALWALPLAALLVVFAGFAMGNRDQVEQIAAVAAGALAQIPLFAAALVGLRRVSKQERDAGIVGTRRALAWPVALLVPIAASGVSWAYFRMELAAFRARAERATANDRAAQEAVGALQDCLAARREQGYPATLDGCPDAARFGEPSGYRIEYLPAVPGADGRIRAYVMCAQPLQFRATGYDTVVADGPGPAQTGGADASTGTPPTCASVLGAQRAIRYCAVAAAASAPARGYPARLAEMADCVARDRAVASLGADVLRTESGESYAYLADPAGEDGRVTHFRVYSLRGRAVALPWIDEHGTQSAAQAAADPALDRLPALADPEAFAPGCEAGGGRDCFLAGYEWQRKAHQTARDARDPSAAPMQERAAAAFERGCALGDERSCEWLASAVEAGLGAERDPQRALALHERACDLGDADGCRGAATICESGRKGRLETLRPQPSPAAPVPDVPRDVPRAVALYQHACGLGDSDSCFIAARLLASGDGIAPDPPRALALFARLCSDGVAIACSRAAALAPADRAEYRRRACALGDPDACS